MATTHAVVTLSNTTATRLTPNGLHSGTDITVQNLHESAYVYLGGEGVSSSSFGYRLAPGTAWSVELSSQSPLYAITATNGSTVAVLKTSLEAGN
jgi:hypothetical protein